MSRPYCPISTQAANRPRPRTPGEQCGTPGSGRDSGGRTARRASGRRSRRLRALAAYLDERGARTGAQSGRPAAPGSPRPVLGTARRLRPAAETSCTRSVSRARMSGSVSGSTPWPRLKTWPGRASRARSRIARARGSTTSQPASSTDGVEVALQRLAAADPARRLVERDPPVDADHVRARLAEQAEQLAGADAEVDARHAGRGERGEDPPGVRQDRVPVVLGADHADPRVEQLHRRRARLDLHLRGTRWRCPPAGPSARATAPGCRTSGPWSGRGSSTGRPRSGRRRA